MSLGLGLKYWLLASAVVAGFGLNGHLVAEVGRYQLIDAEGAYYLRLDTKTGHVCSLKWTMNSRHMEKEPNPYDQFDKPEVDGYGFVVADSAKVGHC